MSYMFWHASSFDHDISSWNTRVVDTMEGMFMDAVVFNHDLSDWFPWETEHLASMCQGAVSFNRDLCDWGNRIPNLSPDGQFTNMFTNTSCPLQNEPNRDVRPIGPFCHSCF
jgi:hypothetical protein